MSVMRAAVMLARVVPMRMMRGPVCRMVGARMMGSSRWFGGEC
jgi:hypothetical protein